MRTAIALLSLASLVVAGLVIPNYTNSNQSKAPQTAYETMSNQSGKEQIKQAISEIAIKYGIDKGGYYRLIMCESSLNTEAVGDSSKAFSLLQFHKPTFYHFCEGDYYSAKDQLNCGARMISEGLGSHWTCLWAYETTQNK